MITINTIVLKLLLELFNSYFHFNLKICFNLMSSLKTPVQFNFNFLLFCYIKVIVNL